MSIVTKARYLHGGGDVDGAGISGKVSVHYPGRPLSLSSTTHIERCGEGFKGVSRAHSNHTTSDEGVNLDLSARHRSCNMRRETENQFEITEANIGSIVQKTGAKV